MAQLSKTIDTNNTNQGIPDEYQKQLSTCFFCDEEIKKGGCWVSNYHIGVCKECSPYLIDLLVDTLEDVSDEFERSSIEKKLEIISRIAKPRLEKKEANKKMLKKNKSMKKLGLRYYAELGIIDFFELSMTSEQIIDNFNGSSNIEKEIIEGCVTEIEKFIEEKTGEKPHTVRFFTIPDFSYNGFCIGAVAKISNNGSTFVFCKYSNYLNGLDVDGCGPTIKKVY